MQQVAQTSERLVLQDAALIAESQKIRYYPLVARSASGCTITDVDGKDYLDLTAGWCVANIGYGHRAVARAVEGAYAELSFACAASLTHPRAVELAQRLAASAPGPGPKKVWFGNSGSDANDGVAKLVPLARKRPRMISFFGGMHGMVAGSAGLSGIPFTTRSWVAATSPACPTPTPTARSSARTQSARRRSACASSRSRCWSMSRRPSRPRRSSSSRCRVTPE